MSTEGRQIIVLMLIACIVWIVWMLLNAGVFGSR